MSLPESIQHLEGRAALAEQLHALRRQNEQLREAAWLTLAWMENLTVSPMDEPERKFQCSQLAKAVAALGKSLD